MNRCLPTAYNLPHCFRAVVFRAALACGWVAGLIAPLAIAQPAPTVPAATKPKPATAPALPVPKPISHDLKTSNALSGADLDVISKFIRDNAARMSGEDTDAAAGGRLDLIAGSASPKPTLPASAVYLQAYLQTLSRELSGLLAKNPGMRLKVNIGVVTARAADNSKTILQATPLQSVVLTLMDDPSDAVALWGMKGAAAILSASNPAGLNMVLLKRIVPAVEKHKLSGPITDEAYTALQEPTPEVIGELMKLYEKRVAFYKEGVPQEASAESRASTRLTIQDGMWSKMSAAEKKKVMNLIADLLAGVSKAILDPEQAKNAEQLHLVASKTSQAVYVVANSNPALAALVDPAKALTKVTNSTPPPAVAKLIEPVVDQIRKGYP